MCRWTREKGLAASDEVDRLGVFPEARKAAKRVLDKAESEGSRVATGFTNDRAELERAWNRLMPVPRPAGYPAVSYHLADRIVNYNDSSPLKVAVAEAIACGAAMPQSAMSAGVPLPPSMQAEAIAKAAARRSLNEHDQESRRAFLLLQGIVRRMVILPGQRTVVLILPGFVTSFLSSDIDAVIDRAPQWRGCGCGGRARVVYSNGI